LGTGRDADRRQSLSASTGISSMEVEDLDEDGGEGGAPLVEVDVDWAALTAALPCGRDPDSERRRKEIYMEWDVNGNGALSFTEVDNGMREMMGKVMGGLLETKMHKWSNSWKPVIMRAFTRSKDSNKKQKSKGKRKDDYVELDEFRLLLLCLRQYFELYVAFSRMDTSLDRRLDFEEFKSALPALAMWNIVLTEEQAEAEFKLIDDNNGGFILFDEFIRWALDRGLDLDDDDDFDDFDVSADGSPF